MTYHISTKFKDSVYFLHTTFDSELTDIYDLTQLAKMQISKKLTEWNKNAENIQIFELYHYRALNEIILFRYEAT